MKKSTLGALLFSGSLSMLAGCSTVSGHAKQNIEIRTPGVKGATCILSNDRGSWKIDPTPGSGIISASGAPLRIRCTKPGYETGSISVMPDINASSGAGNMFFGTFGAKKDMRSGAAYRYRSPIVVPMGRGR